MIELGKYEMTNVEKTIFYILLTVSGGIISLLFYHNILFGIIIIPFESKIKGFVTDEILLRRKREFLVEFKDFLFIVSTAIGAGRSMKDAIAEAIPEIKKIYGDDTVLINNLSISYERMNTGGENDVDVLMDFAVASGMEDCIDFVTIYSICKVTGASLILALNKAASVIIDKMTIDREITELVKRKENEGKIIFLMPFAVVIFLNIFAPDYIAPLYESFTGNIIMTIVIASSVVVYGIIKKIVKVDI